MRAKYFLWDNDPLLIQGGEGRPERREQYAQVSEQRVAAGSHGPGGGLVFIGGTADERFRAYNTETGDLLWEFEGPTSANATPMTYMAGSKQYVVVATGGHNWVYPYKKGDSIVAYSLPD